MITRVFFVLWLTLVVVQGEKDFADIQELLKDCKEKESAAKTFFTRIALEDDITYIDKFVFQMECFAIANGVLDEEDNYSHEDAKRFTEVNFDGHWLQDIKAKIATGEQCRRENITMDECEERVEEVLNRMQILSCKELGCATPLTEYGSGKNKISRRQNRTTEQNTWTRREEVNTKQSSQITRLMAARTWGEVRPYLKMCEEKEESHKAIMSVLYNNKMSKIDKIMFILECEARTFGIIEEEDNFCHEEFKSFYKDLFEEMNINPYKELIDIFTACSKENSMESCLENINQYFSLWKTSSKEFECAVEGCSGPSQTAATSRVRRQTFNHMAVFNHMHRGLMNNMIAGLA